MVIVRVCGGLGNQLFQYAFAKAYSIKNNCEVFLDISAYKNRKITKEGNQHSYYGLKLYKTRLKLATENECAMVKRVVNKDASLQYKIKKALHFPVTEQQISNVIIEKDYGVFKPALLDYRTNLYIQGFLQTDKYFEQYRDEIVKDFTLDIPLDEKNIKMLENIKSTNSVALHVRLGDYIKIKWALPVAYYMEAIESIKLKEKGLHFYIFSNDIDWVLENLNIDAPYTVVDINPPNKGYYDLELMRNCKHNIISKSSFSWWGAWLNTNPNKNVIAPYPWILGKLDCYQDTIPNSWVKLNVSDSDESNTTTINLK